MRRHEALDRLVDDPGNQREEGNGIDQPGDHFESHIAKGALAVRGAAAEAEGGPGKGKAEHVRQVVARIGDQRQRT